jgi:transposase
MKFPTDTPLYVATLPVSMHASFDGLMAAIKNRMSRDLASGGVFLFFNRKRDKLKLIWCDATGVCIVYKRIHRGAFQFPERLGPEIESVAIGRAELDAVFCGAVQAPDVRSRLRQRKDALRHLQGHNAIV